jgi:diacylglycerol kinase (ATP)
MRIALVHNPAAGPGEASAGHLRRLFEDRGHDVQLFGKRKGDLNAAIDSGPDVLAVAGGDGTVAKAAIRSYRRESRAPLFIIPTGTANNVAQSLGIQGTVDQVVAQLDSAVATPLDIGRARGGGRRRFFLESAGLGFIGSMLRNPSPPAGGMAQIIRDQPPMKISLRCDKVDLDGEYVALEALNVSRIGPRLIFAPGANPGDGLLDLALYRESDVERIAAATHDDERVLSSPDTRRARRIKVKWQAQYGHVDDAPWPRDATEEDVKVKIRIVGHVIVLRAAPA